jgi:hypothetical protein
MSQRTAQREMRLKSKGFEKLRYFEQRPGK